MSTKAKFLIGLVVVSAIVGVAIFFYYRGKKKGSTPPSIVELTERVVKAPIAVAKPTQEMAAMAVNEPLAEMQLS